MAYEAPPSLAYKQPIVRGIQNVGSAQIMYRYNYKASDGHYYLPIPNMINLEGGNEERTGYIDCTESGIPVTGFRLDSEFLRANPQIASSFVIPILGGGGVALTNNNRTGTLTLACTKVAAPDAAPTEGNAGAMIKDSGTGIGVLDSTNYYDMVTLAQCQQGQDGGDAYGAQIKIIMSFCGITTAICFDACTVASVDPLGMAGNDAVNYAVTFNYLNWSIAYGKETTPSEE